MPISFCPISETAWLIAIPEPPAPVPNNIVSKSRDQAEIAASLSFKRILVDSSTYPSKAGSSLAGVGFSTALTSALITGTSEMILSSGKFKSITPIDN